MKNLSFVIIAILLAMQVAAQQNPFNFEKEFAAKFLIEDHETDPRLHQYDVGFYHLNLAMDNNSVAVSGNTLVYLNLNESFQNELVFDLKNDMTVSEVLINGVSTSFSHQNDLLVVAYEHSTSYSADYQVCADIHYSGVPTAGMRGDIYNFTGFANYNVTFSLTEPYEAKYWFPCKQVLTDKADSVWVYVTIPDNLLAGSQGLLKNTVDLGNGTKRMEWQSSYPIVYYLISVAVADYQDYSFYAPMSAFDDSVLVQNYVVNHPQYVTVNAWSMNRIKPMMDMLSEKWGKYPFHEEKYGHCLVKLSGAMEHQTMTTTGYFDFRIQVHELGHSWFGNYVTCATWQDIWVNEGFASYAEYLGEEFIQPEGYEDGWLADCQSIARQATTGSVYVPFESLNNPGRIFSYALSYRKGACLVHMIRYLINDDEVFFSFIRHFIEQNANGTATGDDVKNALNDYTGINFDTFFDNWYYGEGYPRYEIEWYQQGNILHIVNMQTTTAASTPFFEIPMEYVVEYSSGESETIRLEQIQNVQEYDIEVNGTVSQLSPDPKNYILKELLSVTFTGNKVPQDLAVMIMPNPATDNICIRSSENMKDVSIYSATGEFLAKYDVQGLEVYISLLHFSQGIYFVEITSYSGRNMWKKFSKL